MIPYITHFRVGDLTKSVISKLDSMAFHQGHGIYIQLKPKELFTVTKLPINCHDSALLLLATNSSNRKKKELNSGA